MKALIYWMCDKTQKKWRIYRNHDGLLVVRKGYRGKTINEYVKERVS